MFALDRRRQLLEGTQWETNVRELLYLWIAKHDENEKHEPMALQTVLHNIDQNQQGLAQEMAVERRDCEMSKPIESVVITCSLYISYDVSSS